MDFDHHILPQLEICPQIILKTSVILINTIDPLYFNLVCQVSCFIVIRYFILTLINFYQRLFILDLRR